jgi:Flp pilus assembly protein TadB
MDFSTITFAGWLIIILSTVFLWLVGNYIFRPRSQVINERIESMQLHSEGTDEEKIMKQSLLKRVYYMLELRTSLFLDKHVKKGKLAPLKIKLLQANDHVTEPMQHRSKMVIFAIAGSLLGLLTKNFTLVLLFGALGAWYPDNKLKEKIKKRQLKIKSELPDFLDLLAATAPSAKNLEDAIKKVCERSEGEVTLEFRRTLEEVNAGRKMRDALNDFSTRCGIEEVQTLVSQINQSEVFGTGVEKTLQVQAEKIRKLKKLLAEIKARKAQVMLLLPSLFLLTTAIIMIAGPSLMDLVTNMGAF